MNILNKSNTVSNAFLIGTILSIAGSIVIWNSGDAHPAHTERLALFVGLWAPTFMGFTNYYKE